MRAQEAVDKWQLSLMKMERHVRHIIYIYSVASGGSALRCVVGRRPVSLVANSGYLWILYFLFRASGVWRTRLRNQFAPYLIGAWRTNIMMRSPALSPLTKQLLSLYHAAITAPYEPAPPYVMPFRLRSSGVLTRLDERRPGGFCRNFLRRRVRAARCCWPADERPPDGRNALSTNWTRFGGARGALWFNDVTSTSRFIRRFVDDVRTIGGWRAAGSLRRPRNISKAADATLMKRVQRPFSEAIALCAAITDVVVPPENVLRRQTQRKVITYS